MKKVIVALAFVLASTAILAAQSETSAIEAIRLRYKGISEKARLAESDIERGRFGDMVMNELVINKLNRQWRAVGIYGQTYKFFYIGGDSEKNLYPDRLVFIKTHKKVSAREYFEEFLFSDRGELVFYFNDAGTADETPAQTRIYFTDSRVIRTIEDGERRDRPTSKDQAKAKSVLARARMLRDLFARSIKL